MSYYVPRKLLNSQLNHLVCPLLTPRLFCSERLFSFLLTTPVNKDTWYTHSVIWGKELTVKAHIIYSKGERKELLFLRLP